MSNTKTVTPEMEAALLAAQEAQTAYWDALNALESELDVNLDDFTGELEGCTVEYLIEEYGEEGEDNG